MPRRVRGPRAQDVSLTAQADEALAAIRGRSGAAGRSIVRRILALRATLREDALHGEPIKKAVLRRSAASRLVRRHGLDNCFCIDLPDGWRLLYTIVREGQQVHVVVVEIGDHGAYDSWFPESRQVKAVVVHGGS